MKTKICLGLTILVGVLSISTPSFALPDLKRVEFALDHGDVRSPVLKLGTQIISNKVQLLKCTYDFTKQGGAIGTINLKAVDGSNCSLPAKAIVADGLIDVVTTLVGATATIAVSTGQGAGDLKAATAIASFTGMLDTVPVSSAATSIKLTAARSPTMTIATAALTAGKFNVFIEYMLSD